MTLLKNIILCLTIFLILSTISIAGCLAIGTVTATIGNTSTWRIPIDETTIITANGQYIGAQLVCNKEIREIVDSIQGTPDILIIEPGNPYTIAPAAISCELDWR